MVSYDPDLIPVVRLKINTRVISVVIYSGDFSFSISKLSMWMDPGVLQVNRVWSLRRYLALHDLRFTGSRLGFRVQDEFPLLLVVLLRLLSGTNTRQLVTRF